VATAAALQAAIRTLNRLEIAGETLRAALNAIAAAAPAWLRGVAPADWHERYDRRVEDARLPEAAAKRDAYALRVGADGYALLDALDRPDTPAALPALPAVAVLRRVWARHYERVAPGAGGSGNGTVKLLGWDAAAACGRRWGDDYAAAAMAPLTSAHSSRPTARRHASGRRDTGRR
jgi:hypothetical protein